jgi:AP-4 complex subunit epsilon-1
VIDCLEDPDETLKRKTLDLLYSMTNPANVMVIVDKLTTFLRATTDIYLRTELVTRINQLAEKFAPNNAWYITTMNTLFELGGELVRPEMGHALMRLLAESGGSTVPSSSGSTTEVDIRTYAVETYIELLRRPVLPDILLQVISWVLGEFGHLSSSMDRPALVRLLGTIMDRHHDDNTTRSWILAAMLKLVAHMSTPPTEVKDLVGKYQSSLFVDLQQRAHEFVELAKTPRTMSAVMPLDAVNEDIKVDVDLSFLDSMSPISYHHLLP